MLAVSCVKQSEYDLLNAENLQLKEQIEDLEFGAERLYKQAFELYKNEELDKAEEKLKNLFERHSHSDEAVEGRKLLQKITIKKLELGEEAAWQTAKAKNTIESFEIYSSEYPKGKYKSSSTSNITVLTKASEMAEYQTALTTTSSSVLKAFVSKYPNNKSSAAFKKRIIELEINEIFGDRNTGQLPSFDKTGESYSATASVSIENGTQCSLTVRYSGSEVRMIEIPAGETRNLTMLSGDYRIAASACGSNYAGTESLHGKYSSRYYISTRRY